MTEIAVLLIVISSFTHAGWNLLVKNARSSAGAFVVANLVGAVLLLPFFIAYRRVVAAMPPGVLLLLVATGFFQALYYASLAGAYRSGELSLIYPLARALPIILVTLASVVLGQAQTLSPLALIGFAAIVVGSLLLPLRTIGELTLARYLRPAVVLALLAAIGTAGYSTIDSGALSQFRAAVAGGLSNRTLSLHSPSWQVPLVYSFFEAVTSGLWLTLFLVCTRSGRRVLTDAWHRRSIASSAMTGIGIYLTYTLVLVSMGFVSNVSYVVAFRQLSIPIGVLFGMTLLREPAYPPKLIGTALMVSGLMLTALG